MARRASPIAAQQQERLQAALDTTPRTVAALSAATNMPTCSARRALDLLCRQRVARYCEIADPSLGGRYVGAYALLPAEGRA